MLKKKRASVGGSTTRIAIKDVQAKKLDLSMNFNSDAAIAQDATIKLTANVDPSKESKFNINKLINKILKSELGVPLDIKIDDSSLPTAPNFVTFLNEPQFLNVRAFARQNEIGTKLFGEYCPDCSDLIFMDNIPVDCSLKKFKRKVQLLDFGLCPKCGKGRAEFIKQGKLQSYQEAAVCCGQRSAKSHVTAMIACYIVHRYLKLQNPTQLLGLVQATTLHGTFVALTYGQAKETLWDPFLEYISASAWFSSYHELLKGYNAKYNEEIFKFKDTFLLYRHRGLLIYPSGPNMKTLRGRTRFFAAIDELGWFDNDAQKNKVKDNANEVYIALERSLLTVRAASNRLLRQGYDNIPTGYFCNVSSPSHARDKIMELINKAKISKKIFALHKPTWEMNPNVTREDLEDEFTKDFARADRDYGANPPLANSPLISNVDMVTQCCSSITNRIESIKYKQRSGKKGDQSRYAIIVPKPVISPTVLTIDAGYSNNSFACTVASIDKLTKFASFKTMVEIQPRPGVPLNYTLIYKYIIKVLIESQNVKIVRADRWNSLKLLSDISVEYPNVDAKQYSVKYNDLTLFKDYIIDKEVVFPKAEWKTEDIVHFNYSEYPKCFSQAVVSHFVMQCVTVQDTGNQVNKGSGLTDDLFRAAALAFTVIMDEKVNKPLLGADAKRTNIAIGNVAGRSFGSSSGGGASIGVTTTGKALGFIGGR
jgi:hypothetical protein